MITGTVKWFSNEKGFGFVEANGKDYFLHFKEINGTGYKSVAAGEQVEFQPETSAKGLCATKVSVIG